MASCSFVPVETARKPIAYPDGSILNTYGPFSSSQPTRVTLQQNSRIPAF